MTFDLRAWAARHGFNGEQAGEALGVDRATFYRYCTQPELPKWLVLACERLDDEWMPIETAPRDGTRVDLWVVFCTGKSGRAGNAAYEDGVWWVDMHGSHLCEPDFRPTHWRPLPKPPTTSAPQSQEK